MPERPDHPEHERSEIAGRLEPDPRSAKVVADFDVELPASLVAAMKERMAPKVETPAYLDIAVMAEFERRTELVASRRRAWRFAAVAASVALLAWAGSAQLGKPRPGPAWKDGGVAGAMGLRSGHAADVALAPKDAPGAPTIARDSSGNEPHDLKQARAVIAAIDADGDGKVDVLDVLRVAKTIEAVRVAKRIREAGEAGGEAGRGDSVLAADVSKQAFWVASLDVTWDLTSDGEVDQLDVDLLASQIVKVGA